MVCKCLRHLHKNVWINRPLKAKLKSSAFFFYLFIFFKYVLLLSGPKGQEVSGNKYTWSRGKYKPLKVVSGVKEGIYLLMGIFSSFGDSHRILLWTCNCSRHSLPSGDGGCRGSRSSPHYPKLKYWLEFYFMQSGQKKCSEHWNWWNVASK